VIHGSEGNGVIRVTPCLGIKSPPQRIYFNELSKKLLLLFSVSTIHSSPSLDFPGASIFYSIHNIQSGKCGLPACDIDFRYLPYATYGQVFDWASSPSSWRLRSLPRPLLILPYSRNYHQSWGWRLETEHPTRTKSCHTRALHLLRHPHHQRRKAAKSLWLRYQAYRFSTRNPPSATGVSSWRFEDLHAYLGGSSRTSNLCQLFEWHITIRPQSREQKRFVLFTQTKLSECA
jgi:hypothetical protein